MTKWNKLLLGKQAKELGFVRDTYEKVCRLTEILKFFESDDLLGKFLALKGGTAINLTIFNLPRLSVDIDLDFSENFTRDEMMASRSWRAECRNALQFSGFFYFLRKEKSMLVHYKKNRKPACYDSDSLLTVGKILPDERPRGPFKSCGNCPYPSHGFICYSSEGDCLKTDMQKICQRKNPLTTNEQEEYKNA